MGILKSIQKIVQWLLLITLGTFVVMMVVIAFKDFSFAFYNKNSDELFGAYFIVVTAVVSFIFYRLDVFWINQEDVGGAEKRIKIYRNVGYLSLILFLLGVFNGIFYLSVVGGLAALGFAIHLGIYSILFLIPSICFFVAARHLRKKMQGDNLIVAGEIQIAQPIWSRGLDSWMIITMLWLIVQLTYGVSNFVLLLLLTALRFL